MMLSLWLFAIATVFHNLEEAIWLPGWIARYGGLPRFPSRFAFRFALVVLSAAFVGVAGVFQVTGGGRLIGTGFALGMGANVFVPHLLLTLRKRRYMPGTGTAVCLTLPAAIGVIGAAAPGDIAFWISAIAVAIGLLACLPLLFGLGHALEKRLT